MTVSHETNRLAVLVVCAIIVCAIGLVTQTRMLLLAAIAPLGYILYGQLTTLPELTVAATRSVEADNPAPGAAVDVTVTVTNTGTHTIPKLHIVDGVPAELGVARGSPRRATALRPGESTTVTYTVVAKRGVHEFGDTYLNGQSFSGTSEREHGVDPTGVTVLTCQAAIDEPLDLNSTHQYTGQIATDEGGSGLEFHATREYRHGDPVTRVDWNRYAKEGTLTTVDYRERSGAPVVVLIDLRSAIDVARRAIDPPASELNIYAAHRLCRSLVEYGNEVGIAVYTDQTIEWLPLGRGADHISRIEMAIHDASDREWSTNTTTLGTRRTRGLGRGRAILVDRQERSEHAKSFERLETRLPATANLHLVTPVLDSFPQRAVEHFVTVGHDVTILSPNVVARSSPGERLAGLDREIAIAELQQAGAGVVSWDPSETLAEAIARTPGGPP